MLDSELRTLEGIGHLPPLQTREAVSGVPWAFLARCSNMKGV